DRARLPLAAGGRSRRRADLAGPRPRAAVLPRCRRDAPGAARSRPRRRRQRRCAGTGPRRLPVRRARRPARRRTGHRPRWARPDAARRPGRDAGRRCAVQPPAPRAGSGGGTGAARPGRRARLHRRLGLGARPHPGGPAPAGPVTARRRDLGRVRARTAGRCGSRSAHGRPGRRGHSARRAAADRADAGRARPRRAGERSAGAAARRGRRARARPRAGQPRLRRDGRLPRRAPRRPGRSWRRRADRLLGGRPAGPPGRRPAGSAARDPADTAVRPGGHGRRSAGDRVDGEHERRRDGRCGRGARLLPAVPGARHARGRSRAGRTARRRHRCADRLLRRLRRGRLGGRRARRRPLRNAPGVRPGRRRRARGGRGQPRAGPPGPGPRCSERSARLL
ncbi:MAG: hypothetical protein AVDCRST_MAG07-3543, partial [uncultured Frankineae bacterium]